ncbi:50S ribosomal protein L23 [Candidatus Dependentiae bacterium]
MELSVYEIIKKVVITEKSTGLFKKLGKLTFEVNKNSNKIMVKHAVEKIWNVVVDNIRMIKVPGKSKTFARKSFVTSSRKKAIVTLKKGYKIDLPQFETMGVSETVGVEKNAKIEEK